MRNLISCGALTSGLFLGQIAIAQSVHDHGRFHGTSVVLPPSYASPETGIHAELLWNNSSQADLDFHFLLPDGYDPYLPTVLLGPDPTHPFASENQSLHLSPRQPIITFNNGSANATHSGDAGGLVAFPAGGGCENESGTCEGISVTGNVPTSLYQLAAQNYDANNLGLGADYSIYVYATGSGRLITDNHLPVSIVSGTLSNQRDIAYATAAFYNPEFLPHAVGTPPLFTTDEFYPEASTVAFQHQQAKLSEIAPVYSGDEIYNEETSMEEDTGRFLGDFYRHGNTIYLIEEYDEEIEASAKRYGIDADLIRATIFEEQSHLEFGEEFAERLTGYGNTVGVGQMTIGTFGTRKQLLDPEYSIDKMGEHYQSLQKRLELFGMEPNVYNLSTLYNCGSCMGVFENGKHYIINSSNYGVRVDGYYQQFHEQD